MKTKHLIIAIMISLISFSLFSSDNIEQSRLNDISAQLRIKSMNERIIAEDYARTHGLAMKISNNEGMIAELMKIENGKPIYYITHNSNGAALIKTSRLYPSGGAGLSLTGNGQVLGEWDGGSVFPTHQELNGRVTIMDGSSHHWHAAHVAGTMIASGLVTTAKGMSYQATLKSYDWTNDESEMASEAASGLKTSNHSYGTVTGWTNGDYGYGTGWYWFGINVLSQTEDASFGYYDSIAQDWDLVAYNAPNYLIVKSAGNDRGEGPTAGTFHYYIDYSTDPYSWASGTTSRDKDGGLSGYDCMSASSTSKNVITIGAVDNTYNMSSFSGWGPTDDGRVKPDVVAKGVSVYSSVWNSADPTATNYYGGSSGTSMSSPMVTGSIGILLHHQNNLNPGTPMKSASMKGLIIHTANNSVFGVTGPDYRFGWGLMDTEKAANLMTLNETTNFNIQELSLANNEEKNIFVQASGTEPLRATIVWTDVPGTVPPFSLDPTNLILVNDLDMRISNGNLDEFMPYILNPASPSTAATTGDNYRDNVEMVHIQSPGTNEIYTINISHKGTLYNSASQPFSLIISGGSAYNPTLPVTLSSFDAIYSQSNQVLLTWITQSESNVFGYHIFRNTQNSLDTSIRISSNIIPAHNTSTENIYSFTDSQIEYDTEYYYWLQAIDLNGENEYHGPIHVLSGPIIETPNIIPIITSLKSAYPNPFNPDTNIQFQLAESNHVRIDIFNNKGQIIKQLYNTYTEAGNHSVLWDGKDSYGNICSSGVYFYRMQAGEFVQSKKMMLIK